MARPRKTPLWESADGLVYVRQRKAGFSIFDTRDGREYTRAKYAVAEAFAAELAGSTSRGASMTFMELAEHYFDEALPLAEGTTDESGLSEVWVEDIKGYVRNWYTEALLVRLCDLPVDFIEQAERRVRGAGRSKSLQDKVVGIGQKLVKHGKRQGWIAEERVFPRHPRAIRSKKGSMRGQSHKAMTRRLPSHRDVGRFARAYARATERMYMRLFWWLAFYVGFRVGELIALEVDDVVTERGRVCIWVTKKVVRSRSERARPEPYAKGYAHRLVVVPTFLAEPLLRRVAEVRASGGTLLFPSWSPIGPGPDGAPQERWIPYDTLYRKWVTVGASIGWEVASWREARDYVSSDGKTRHYAEKVGSLVFHPHDARAYAATVMYAEYRGIAPRGMGMSIKAIAKQLGDNEDVVRAHYLGLIDSESDDIYNVVP